MAKKVEDSSPQAYVAPVSEKEKLVEKLKKDGFSVEYGPTGIPMFKISSIEEADVIREKIGGRFSFGYQIKNN